jgi:hypothetical protein
MPDQKPAGMAQVGIYAVAQSSVLPSEDPVNHIPPSLGYNFEFALFLFATRATSDKVSVIPDSDQVKTGVF